MVNVNNLNSTVDLFESYLISLRRELHEHPELSFKEYETTDKIFNLLKKEGLSPSRFKETTGLFVDLHSDHGQDLPLILVRADIDALPIRDLKTVAYHSKNEGVMHACGHDAHTSAVVGVLLALNKLKSTANFNVRAIFQPAEELGTGAKALITQGVLLGVKYALSLHVDPIVPFGQIAVKAGPVNAAVVEFAISLKGKTAHVARIHQGLDTIGPACQLISQCYSLIPKKIDAREPSLIYFGKFQAGVASNIVCDEVNLLGTIRTFNSDVSHTILTEMKKIGEAIADSAGLEFELTEKVNLKAVVNDSFIANELTKAAMEIVNPLNVITDLPTSMGGEDFGEIMSLVPGAMMRLGVKNENGITHGLHTPEFDIPDSAIAIGSKVLTNAILKISEIKD